MLNLHFLSALQPTLKLLPWNSNRFAALYCFYFSFFNPFVHSCRIHSCQNCCLIYCQINVISYILAMTIPFQNRSSISFNPAIIFTLHYLWHFVRYDMIIILATIPFIKTLLCHSSLSLVFDHQTQCFSESLTDSEDHIR